MLPGLDGLPLIAGLQSEGVVAPVVVLSTLSDVDERVRRLKSAGDDCLPKPFALAELTARIDPLLRDSRNRAACRSP
jgi:two-component system, OmpR family, response regulator